MIGILIDISTRDLSASTGTDSTGKLKGIDIGDNRADIIERVFDAHPGEFKHRPEIGYFIRKLQGGNRTSFTVADAIKQLKYAQIDVVNVGVNEDNEIYVNYD